MCTGLTLQATNGDIFFGRTLDLDIPMFGEDSGFAFPASIMNIPANIQFPSQLNKWTTKYAVLGICVDQTTCLFDGINEEGLVGDCQVLKESTWKTKADMENSELIACMGEEFVAYVLTNFKNVAEIREKYQTLCQYDQKFMYQGSPVQYQLHFTFVDQTGDGVVLEPVNDGEFKLYDFVGVTANSPEYDYHKVNIRNYIGLRNVAVKDNTALKNSASLQPIEGGTGYGLFGLPGDYTSPSRFVKAFFVRNLIDSFDRENGIAQLYAAFRPLIIPRGLEHTNETTSKSDYTRYWSGYDISTQTLYVQSGVALAFTSKTLNRTISTIEYEPIDISNHTHSLN